MRKGDARFLPALRFADCAWWYLRWYMSRIARAGAVLHQMVAALLGWPDDPPLLGFALSHPGAKAPQKLAVATAPGLPVESLCCRLSHCIACRLVVLSVVQIGTEAGSERMYHHAGRAVVRERERAMADLTAVAARNAKPREKAYRLAAGAGLYLQVMPTGAKYWRLKYRFGKAPKMIGLGVFPAVSLAEARVARDEARTLLASGIDPSTQRRVDKLQRAVAIENSLEAVARAWFAEREGEWVDTYARTVMQRLELNIFPWLGALPVTDVTPQQILAALQQIHARGATETAHRTRQYLSDIFRWAIVNNKAERDPAADVKGAIPPAAGGSFPTLTDPDRIGELLRAIDGYRGTFVTRAALKLAPLLFTRPGELRKAEWSEFDLVKGDWTVPGTRLKMRKAKKAKAQPHIVPLSRQALAILHHLQPLTGAGRYVFPGERTATRPMSDNTLNAALHALGFKGEIVTHGFRHMASTALNEAGWSEDAIERQLAHKDKNRVRGIYNLAKYIAERRRMMQAWADYLDGLRSPTAAVPLRAVG